MQRPTHVVRGGDVSTGSDEHLGDLEVAHRTGEVQWRVFVLQG